MVSEAKRRASKKYQQKTRDTISVQIRKETKARWKEASDRASESLSGYIQKAVEQRIEREASEEGSILAEAIMALAETHSYLVTFRVRRGSPSGEYGRWSWADTMEIEASSEVEARNKFFDRLVNGLPDWRIVSRDSQAIIMSNGETIIEECEIIKVEER